ncbi:tyrosine-type recombinase/integrase [Planosporangium thailandense]|uniref:Tyrosine-type recombinase/integrase n=1 Tax=Planosporangium thailandense TaxID=765197 RepID=A0ABX0Y3E1_9ACTN|nr:tyrosine-type recombinase/integrase [Planosporangium thailandense]
MSTGTPRRPAIRRGYTAGFTDRSTGDRPDGSRGRRSPTPAPGCPRRRDTRSAALPGELHRHRDRQGANLTFRLVFATTAGTALDRHNVLRAFRPIVRRAGLDPNEWTPRELRHSFVSLLSDKGMRSEDITDLRGHSGMTVTESAYRHHLRPVLLSRAIAMDEILGVEPEPGA